RPEIPELKACGRRSLGKYRLATRSILLSELPVVRKLTPFNTIVLPAAVGAEQIGPTYRQASQPCGTSTERSFYEKQVDRCRTGGSISPTSVCTEKGNGARRRSRDGDEGNLGRTRQHTAERARQG